MVRIPRWVNHQPAIGANGACSSLSSLSSASSTSDASSTTSTFSVAVLVFVVVVTVFFVLRLICVSANKEKNIGFAPISTLTTTTKLTVLPLPAKKKHITETKQVYPMKSD